MSVETHNASSSTDFDPFTDDVLLDPFPHYKALRDIAPAIYLEKYGFYGLFRYDEISAELADWETFSSAQGVTLNPMANEALKDNVLSTDPPRHEKIRKVFDASLRPKFIRKVAGDLERRAEELVDELMERGEFDGVADFAQRLPVDIVLDLVGLPRDENRNSVLDWASAVTNFMGPPGARQEAALPAVQAQVSYLVNEAKPERMLPGSFGEVVYASADRGEITHQEAIDMMMGYATAGLDTTISSAASTLWMLAQHPEQWQEIRQDHSLIPPAFLEAVRLESPVQYFSRVTTRDVEIGETTVPKGARIIHSLGSANRDERHYPEPDRFDIHRNPVDLLSFSAGVHSCPGRTLASLEGHALFSALAARVSKIELNGEPTRHVNNVTRGLASLPVRIS
ncbi:cytochrome P450 [Pseudonocardia alni]|uniref:cytochrome P450 n=1 Tax=Pseudonocardia alni TaxID=33907 RepID=UPI00280B0154|nr:cytochrome P450 [Pseudonocardia alni]